MVDPLGLTIFLVGIGLLVIELANPGYFVGVAGTTGIIVGLIQMAWPDVIFRGAWSPFIVAGIALVALAVSIVFYRRFAPPVKAPETLSSDALVGQTGKVVSAVDPESLKGKVRLGGIVWSATGDEAIEEGADVVVQRVDGVHLVVARAAGGAAAPSPTGESSPA